MIFYTFQMNEEGLKNLLGSVSQQLEKSTKVTVCLEVYVICLCATYFKNCTGRSVLVVELLEKLLS